MKKLMVTLLIISVLMLAATWTQVEGAEASADVGIAFNDKTASKIPDTKQLSDNTPKAGVKPLITKRGHLPQTGEMFAHLGFLMTGIVAIILIFTIVLDKQIRLMKD